MIFQKRDLELKKSNVQNSSPATWEGGLVAKNTWKSYVQEDCSIGFVGYLEANEHIIPNLKNKIESANDFAALKDEILNFIKEREKFIKYAWNNVP